MNTHHFCVIMAGGAGTDPALLRATYERFCNIVPQKNILVITLERCEEKIRTAIPELPAENILLEPYRRQTAPCITYATFAILARDPQASVVVTPSDHIIQDEDKYIETITHGLEYIESSDKLMTVGTVPDHIDTNYGYVQVKGGRSAIVANIPARIKTFTEKPDEEIARAFTSSGEFLWNTGIYIWKASVIRDELEIHVPEITTLFGGWEESLGTDRQAAFLEKAYGECPKISIDYAVMEKTDQGMVIPSEFRWTDALQPTK